MIDYSDLAKVKYVKLILLDDTMLEGIITYKSDYVVKVRSVIDGRCVCITFDKIAYMYGY